jgi:hypothetical protein
MSSVDIFLDELNKQNNRELDLKNSLENKSTSITLMLYDINLSRNNLTS